MRVKIPDSIKKYSGIIPVALLGAAVAGNVGHYIGNQNGNREGYSKGYTEGYDEGYDEGFNKKDEYKYYNVKDGMNYGIQRQYDEERTYFLNLNETELDEHEFYIRAHRLIQSIKMLFRNKADVFAQNEDGENDRLEFREDGIYISGENSYSIFEFGQEDKNTALYRFTLRMIQLQKAVDNSDLKGIQEALGGKKIDPIMRFLSSCYILQLPGGATIVAADPDFDKIKDEYSNKWENGGKVVLPPTIQANQEGQQHKPYEASNLIIEANKAAEAIKKEQQKNNEKTRDIART